MASFADQEGSLDLQNAPFVHAKHVAFLKALQDKVDTFEYCVTEHLRMSAVYWTMTALILLGKEPREEMDVEGILAWIRQCRDPESGLGCLYMM